MVEQCRWNSVRERVDQWNSENGTVEDGWRNSVVEQWNSVGGIVEQCWWNSGTETVEQC